MELKDVTLSWENDVDCKSLRATSVSESLKDKSIERRFASGNYYILSGAHVTDMLPSTGVNIVYHQFGIYS